MPTHTSWRSLLVPLPQKNKGGVVAKAHARWLPALQNLLAESSAPDTIRLDGKSLLAHAIEMEAGWAISPLARGGCRPAPGEDVWASAWRKGSLIQHWRALCETQPTATELNIPCAKSGNTALYSAISHYHKAADWLLDNGASATQANAEGRTPLHAACTGSEILCGARGQLLRNRLLRLGASYNTRDAKGITPFELLMPSKHGGIFLSVFESAVLTADPNQMLSDGFRPLTRVLLTGSSYSGATTASIVALLKAGADWFALNADETTAMEHFPVFLDSHKASGVDVDLKFIERSLAASVLERSMNATLPAARPLSTRSRM